MKVLDRKTVIGCQWFNSQMVLCWSKYTLEWLREEIQLWNLSWMSSSHFFSLSFGNCYCRHYRTLLSDFEFYSSYINNFSSARFSHYNLNSAVPLIALFSVKEWRKFLLWSRKLSIGSRLSYLAINFPVLHPLFRTVCSCSGTCLQLLMGLSGRGGLMLQFKEKSKIVFFVYVLTVRGVHIHVYSPCLFLSIFFFLTFLFFLWLHFLIPLRFIYILIRIYLHFLHTFFPW